MIRLLADENFKGQIVRALRLHLTEIDLVTVQELGLSGATDPVVLATAAQDGRVVLSHDVNTMTLYAIDRIEKNVPMPGLLIVRTTSPAIAIEDISLIALAGEPQDFAQQIKFIPL